MDVALIGYGKMGKIIEELLLQRNHKITHRIDSTNADEDWSSCDVAIEFSHPNAVISNIEKAVKNGTPIVVGTTGWQGQLQQIEALVNEKKAALFHASNFSLGVNIFYQLNQKLAQIMSQQKDYGAYIEETHHIEKKDAPSGTAISIAEQIIELHDQYNSWSSNAHEEKKIQITSHRLPDVKGDHSVIYESTIDKIEIKHHAKNRHGFALGAILAAEFLKNKKGVYTMNDLLNF